MRFHHITVATAAAPKVASIPAQNFEQCKYNKLQHLNLLIVSRIDYEKCNYINHILHAF